MNLLDFFLDLVSTTLYAWTVVFQVLHKVEVSRDGAERKHFLWVCLYLRGHAAAAAVVLLALPTVLCAQPTFARPVRRVIRLRRRAGAVGGSQPQDERHLIDLAAFLLSTLVLPAQVGDLQHDVLLQEADLLQERVFMAVLLATFLPQQLA